MIDRDARLRKEIANNLKRLLKEHKTTQAQLSEATNIARSTISDYARAATMMKLGNLEKIAAYFGVNKSEIDPTFKSMQPVDYNNFVNIPIVGDISAGEPVYAEEDIQGYLPVLDAMLKSGSEYFVLEVKGDSMNLEFDQGSLLLVEQTKHIENGQIGVFKVNGNDATVKKVSLNSRSKSITLIPMSTNSDHQPITYNADEHEVSIIGRVVQATKMY